MVLDAGAMTLCGGRKLVISTPFPMKVSAELTTKRRFTTVLGVKGNTVVKNKAVVIEGSQIYEDDEDRDEFLVDGAR
ncbi:hypothetical protein HUT03_00250 [Candidatus Liberibacter africanus]|uniref:Uncharacterized protein n=1 Tax=Candidatus Liberibacter africanus PTSAPSY TaxID=1277257 RepID=A0A0G3I398_LIBAF|nr:hypothetical protein [Candidatus Liberibacter africanus]AKK19710.1 hypothetical protein G293_00265 [Candidatus Liberibacter africanus PTSAPSY]QTP63592.1 hypothetical protein HUT03_00250 [Candidatus Liberibacter africanus]